MDPTPAASVPPGKMRPARSSDPLPRPSGQDPTVSNDVDPAIPAAAASVLAEKDLETAQTGAEDDQKMSKRENSEVGSLEDVKPSPIQLPPLRTEALHGRPSSRRAGTPTEPTRLDSQFPQSLSSQGRRRTMSGSQSRRSPNDPRSGETTYRQHRRNVSKTMRELSDMLGTLLAAQLKVQEARTSLKNCRRNLADLDGQFLRKLQMILAAVPNAELASLLQLGENVSASRDEMFPIEDDYNILEDQLIRDEFELKEAITSLVPQLERSSGALLPGDQTSSLAHDAYDGLPPFWSPDGEIQHPDLGDYLSCLGDVKLAQERLDGLRRERAHLVEEGRIRSRYGLGLSQESRDFLNNFDAQHEEYQRQVATAQLELDRIKGLLALSGLKDMDPYNTNVFDDQTSAAASAVSSPYVESAGSFIILNDRASRSASPSRPPSPRDWIQGLQNPRLDPLLSAVDDTSPVFPVTDEGEKGTIDINTYIHDWLLNRLRRSSLEVMRFRSAEQLQSHGILQNQQRDVIVHWISQDERPDPTPSKRKGRPSSTSALPTREVERAVTRNARSDSVPTIDALAGQLRWTGPSLRISDVVRENTSGHAKFLAQSGRLGRGLFH